MFNRSITLGKADDPAVIMHSKMMVDILSHHGFTARVKTSDSGRVLTVAWKKGKA